MNLKYMNVSLFEITYKKNELFHDILIHWNAPVYAYTQTHVYTEKKFWSSSKSATAQTWNDLNKQMWNTCPFGSI